MASSVRMKQQGKQYDWAERLSDLMVAGWANVDARHLLHETMHLADEIALSTGHGPVRDALVMRRATMHGLAGPTDPAMVVDHIAFLARMVGREPL